MGEQFVGRFKTFSKVDSLWVGLGTDSYWAMTEKMMHFNLIFQSSRVNDPLHAIVEVILATTVLLFAKLNELTVPSQFLVAQSHKTTTRVAYPRSERFEACTTTVHIRVKQE